MQVHSNRLFNFLPGIYSISLVAHSDRCLVFLLGDYSLVQNNSLLHILKPTHISSISSLLAPLSTLLDRALTVVITFSPVREKDHYPRRLKVSSRETGCSDLGHYSYGIARQIDPQITQSERTTSSVVNLV